MAYVSNTLTHWVGRNKSDDEKYELLANNILMEKELLYNPCPWVFHSKYGGVTKFEIEMISFTDIPFSECKNHCDKYSHFGLSFEKHYMANCLACPVGYVQNPFIHQNYSYIYHTLNGIKGLTEITIPEGKKKGKKLDVHELLSRFQHIMIFLENYSKNEFIYNELKEIPHEGQDDFFEDASALYYEREWRMVLNSISRNIPWNVTHNGRTFFKFNEKYLKWVIVPRNYVHKIRKEHGDIFKNYNYIPNIIAYEDLAHF